MPRLSLWSIRAALVYLGLGFTFGALLLWNKGAAIYPMLWSLLPLHIEVVLIGWTLQLAMGVAYWIAPRRYTSRGTVRLAAISFVLLNVGVWICGTAHWLSLTAVLLIVGRTLEMLAVVLFAAHLWPRIRPAG